MLQYLSVNAYFDISPQGKKSKFELGLKLEKNEKLVNAIHECLIEYVGVMLTKYTFNTTASTDQTKALYSLLIELVELIKFLIEDKQVTSIKLCDKLARKETELKELCAKIVKLLKDLLASINATTGENKGEETTVDVYQTFVTVVAIEFFRMFDSVKGSKQIVDDIEICMQKFDEEQSGKQQSVVAIKDKMNKKIGIYEFL